MFKNYLKIAWRYLLKYRQYSIINILGLAVGITCCILIMLFVRSEFSYDRFHSNANRLYRVWQHERADGEDFINTVTPLPMAAALQTTYPEVESTCRVYLFNSLIKLNNTSFNENITMVDSTFFQMFSFKLLSGSEKDPFPTSNSIILTPATAKKYFGNSNAIGKTIEIPLGNEKTLFTVAGIAEPSPEESSIKYDMLIPYSNAKSVFNPRMLHNWFNVFNETYVLLRKNVKVTDLERKFPLMMKQQLGENYGKEEFNVHLQPITNVHLNTSLPAGIQPTSNPKYAYILATIGILILLVACINFITLSIGRSTSRALEVGVRKALGAERKQLIRQFWGEAMLMTLIAVIIGLAISFLLLQPFNHLIERNLVMHFDILFIAFCFLLIAVIGLLAGIYPAIILSGFNAVEVLKGKLSLKNNAGFFRKALITGQFVASIVMIICTMIIGQQMHYLQTKDLGYNKEHVIIVPTNKNRKDGFALAELYKNELQKQPGILDVSASVFSLAEIPWATLGFKDSKNIYRDFQFNQVDPYFIDAMKIKMAKGRSFQPDNKADYNNSVIVNEALVKEFGLKDPVGKKFDNYSQTIIGVMKDFNYESLHTPVKPLVLSLNGDTIMRQSSDISFAISPQPRISVRLKPGDISKEISMLKDAWKTIAPNQDFEYHFLDEALAASYKQEQKMSVIVRLASALSIFIACMGLFGLATLTVVKRTKEIGIRKVLGANVGSIVKLLSTDFVWLVVIAAVIAFPVAWWAMHQWLADFAYRVGISVWVFFIAATTAIIIALATVSMQAIKAAIANPVKSLRTE